MVLGEMGAAHGAYSADDLTVTVTGSIEVGDLTARPPRRNLREWLRGDPEPYPSGP